MSNLWFTSDTHWQHNRVQAFCPDTRFQGSLEEHDEMLIEAWNSRVKPGDRIYHLGDVAFGSSDHTESVLSRLNGHIHLIYGNHDAKLSSARFARYFESRDSYKTIRVDGIKVVMFHFPIAEWDQCHRGAFHLFGHVHASYGTVGGRSLNVGIDNRPGADMAPWSWDEVKAVLEPLPPISHH